MAKAKGDKQSFNNADLTPAQVMALKERADAMRRSRFELTRKLSIFPLKYSPLNLRTVLLPVDADDQRNLCAKRQRQVCADPPR